MEYDKSIFARNLKRYMSIENKAPADIVKALQDYGMVVGLSAVSVLRTGNPAFSTLQFLFVSCALAVSMFSDAPHALSFSSFPLNKSEKICL